MILFLLGFVFLAVIGLFVVAAMLIAEQREIKVRVGRVETNTKEWRSRQSKMTHDAPLVAPQIERPKQVGPRHPGNKGGRQFIAIKRKLVGGESSEG